MNPQNLILQRVRDLTATLMEEAYVRVERAGAGEWPAAVAVFEGLARGVRMTIALELRVGAAARLADQALARYGHRASAPRERLDMREREREAENDGYDATPVGRVEALASVLSEHPELDPGGHMSAEVIILRKALDAGPPPGPPPRGPRRRPPFGPPQGWTEPKCETGEVEPRRRRSSA